jgi:hypothetical protein
MYVRGDIALVGWFMVGVFVFCVVTVVADFLELLFNLRKLTHAGWGTKGNHRIFREARQWRVIDMTI